MYWLIQDNVFAEPFYDKLIDYLTRLDIPYEIVKAVPFTGEIIPEPKLGSTEKVVAIGSYSFVLKARELYEPGCWVNSNYDYRVWSEKWKGFVLNDPAKIYKFKDVPLQEKPFFIRPCSDGKSFTGHVTDWEKFSIWRNKIKTIKKDLIENPDFIDDRVTLYDEAVLISEPKKIVEEYRFIVIQNKVITGSLYKVGSTVLYKEVTEEHPGWNFAQEMTDIWNPSIAFALDIALSDGKYYVLEMGNVNAAGLYHCDVQKFVNAIEAIFD